jgi:ABC-type transport system involved in multi-copper enzyme maturation permease subunit
MAAILHPVDPATATLLLAGRELRLRLGSVWFWAVASTICLMAWLYGAGFLAGFETESVIVTNDPLLALNALVTIFLGVVLGLRLAASMAWEREHRTLEILLIGPAGWGAILGAKLMVEIAVLALLVLVYAFYLAAAQPLGAGVIGTGELSGLLLVPVFALPVMALGLLVGAGLGTVRAAVVVFLVLLGALAAVEVAHALLAAQSLDRQSLAGLYARQALDRASPVLDPISPAHALALPVRALMLQAPLLSEQAVLPLGQSVVLVALSVIAGRARGALR